MLFSGIITYSKFLLTDDRFSWKSSQLALATETNNTKEIRTTQVIGGEFSYDSMSQSMGLDNHTSASVISGLIDHSQGASNFLDDLSDPGETTVTLGWTLQSKAKRLDLKTLVHQGIPHLPTEGEEQSNATHVVVGILYGAEAYCVLAQDHNGRTENNDAKKIQERMSEMAKKFGDGLSENKDLVNFKEQFSKKEKQQLTILRCRLYSDFQTHPVRKCNFFDAYKQMDNLFAHILRTDNQSKAVPIAVQLCPLEFLFDPSARYGSHWFPKYCDIKPAMVNFFSRIFVDLKEAIAKAEKMCEAKKENDKVAAALREFIAAASAYQNYIKSSLKIDVAAARNYWSDSAHDSLKNFFGTVEKIKCFRSAGLEQWLSLKSSELDMMDSMINGARNGITILSDRNQLKETQSKKYAFVLFVPPLDEMSNAILKTMKEHCEGGRYGYFHYYGGGEPWYLMSSKRKYALEFIEDLARHAEKQISSQVQFIVTFSESSKIFECSYSVYEDGILLKSNIDHLPGPPTDLQVHHPITKTAKRSRKELSSVTVEWDYEDVDYPCNFIVEYRKKGSSDPWIRRGTTESGQTQLAINVPTGSSMEFRVAADTCVGYSDFSDVIDTELVEEETDDMVDIFGCCPKVNKEVVLLPPSDLKLELVTHNAVKLKWTPPPVGDLCCLSYLVRCWKKGEDPSSNEQKIGLGSTTFSFNDCEPETTYLLNISTIVEDFSKTGEPSETLEFTTPKKMRFAEKFVNQCQKIGNENNLDLYAVPLTKVNSQLATADRFVFDSKGEGKNNVKPRTILLIGASDSDKTSLINSFVNCIFDVELEDPFRFQLIDPSREESGKVTIYDIHHNDEFCIADSLKIIDTPNYVDDDPTKNKEITELIRKFFDDKMAVQEVDMICIVLDSSSPDKITGLQIYTYCSLLTIFGNGIKDDVHFIANNQDDDPDLLTDIGRFGGFHQNFDSSVYFRSSVDPEYFRKCIADFKRYSSFQWETPKFASLTKQVIGYI